MFKSFIGFSHYLSQLTQFVFPNQCLFCGNKHIYRHQLCQSCLQFLPFTLNHCCQCAIALVLDTQSRCGNCIRKKPFFDLTYALFHYQPPMIHVIYALKFKHELKFARFFGELLSNQILESWYLQQSLPDIILPVPLHPIRLKTRGFNQSLEIARFISNQLKIPLDIFSVKRILSTPSQSKLSALDRLKNVKNVFKTQHDFKNLSVAIVDDVMTTGSTVAALAKLLKAKGAKNVHVWCCLRGNIALPLKKL